MPIRVYLQDGLIRLDFSGYITKNDFFGALNELEAIEDVQAVTPHRIANLTGSMDTENRFPEMMAVAAKRRLRTFPNAFKTAIVAPQPVNVGTARRFQTLNDHSQITLEIFPDLAAAQAWLAAP